MFQQITFDWESCSEKCSQRDSCNFWEYNENGNLCIMIESYDYLANSGEKTYIGNRDCPGPIELRNSMFGTCVEHHPSMWGVLGGEHFFNKDLKVEKNDPTVLVLGGGLYHSFGLDHQTDAVEVLGDYNCPWPMPKLPDGNDFHTMAMTPEGIILSCGGREDLNAYDCITYDTTLKQWIQHSSLRRKRMGASAVTLPNGVYILGGIQNPFESEFLPKGSMDWIEGPTIPIKTMQSCVVGISNTQFVVIGGGIISGLDWEAYRHTRVYDTAEDTWTSWQDLQEPRFGHGCAKLGNKIIVAGGRNGWGRLATTEIIDIATGVVRPGGKMSKPRQDLQLVTLGGHHQRIIAVGGITSGWTADYDLDIIEEWNEQSDTWVVNPTKLQTARHRFGAVAVPQSRIC